MDFDAGDCRAALFLGSEKPDGEAI